MLTQKRLQELFDYHRDGYFVSTGLGRNCNGWPKGKIAKGTVTNQDTYVVITVDGKRYSFCKAVWLWHTGEYPKNLEYVDDNPLNTRIENLKLHPTGQDGVVVTQKLLKELFTYDGSTGYLIWKKTRGKVKKGTIAGYVQNGYRKIVVNKINYPASKLVLLMLDNIWPSSEQTIDHIDRDRDNNRRENLRLLTRSEQQINRGRNKHSQTGITGVSITDSDKYRVYISIDGENKQVGSICHSFKQAVLRRYEAEKTAGWLDINPQSPAAMYVKEHFPDKI